MAGLLYRLVRRIRGSSRNGDLDLRQSLGDYWLRRVLQHFGDSYAGVKMLKFPEDLRAYEHILWSYKPNTVIEIGTQTGGSALWFRDRLQTLEHYGLVVQPRVISVDLDIEDARRNLARVDPTFESTITLISGDVRDPGLPATVEQALPPAATCLVVEDSAHTYETTSAALAHFSRFVPVGGFFVVEDGCVDIERMRASPDWPRGVLPAVHDFLSSELGESFEIRRDMELYGITAHPQGFLQRVR
jgi:cephalosporin hydroxylase